MYKDFIEKHPGYCTYETYRKVFDSLQITIGEPEMDKCDYCAYNKQHEGEPGVEEESQRHSDLARERRLAYQKDVQEDWDSDTKVFAADLQKVLLLPLMHDLKVCVFTPRLVVFNETFAELKPKGQVKKHNLVVWDESEAGRKKEDITSAFYKVIKEEKDAAKIIFWLDNCSGQNKNWTLYSVLALMVNQDVGPSEIVLKYLEPGHTSMAADSLHGHIEKELRRQKDVLTRDDLHVAMKKAVKGANLLTLKHSDFYDWENEARSRGGRGAAALPLLKDIVEVKFLRGEACMFYKVGGAAEFTRSNFLKKKAATSYLHRVTPPPPRSHPRGISKAKKRRIIDQVTNRMPQEKRVFWQNMPDSDTSDDLLNRE